MHFVCELCEAFFESANEYERHLVTAHRSPIPGKA